MVACGGRPWSSAGRWNSTTCDEPSTRGRSALHVPGRRRRSWKDPIGPQVLLALHARPPDRFVSRLAPRAPVRWRDTRRCRGLAAYHSPEVVGIDLSRQAEFVASNPLQQPGCSHGATRTPGSSLRHAPRPPCQLPGSAPTSTRQSIRPNPSEPLATTPVTPTAAPFRTTSTSSATTSSSLTLRLPRPTKIATDLPVALCATSRGRHGPRFQSVGASLYVVREERLPSRFSDASDELPCEAGG